MQQLPKLLFKHTGNKLATSAQLQLLVSLEGGCRASCAELHELALLLLLMQGQHVSLAAGHLIDKRAYAEAVTQTLHAYHMRLMRQLHCTLLIQSMCVCELCEYCRAILAGGEEIYLNGSAVWDRYLGCTLLV